MTTPLADRIHDLGHVLVAGLPASKRQHHAARLDAADHARLDRLMTAVVRALPLGPGSIALRVFGVHPDAPGIASLVEAGRLVTTATGNADLRAAADALGSAAQEIGLDRFKPFLKKADDHLTARGGLVTLARDVPVSPPQAAPQEAPTKPSLPPPGQLMPFLLRTLGPATTLVLGNEAIKAYDRADLERQLRSVLERFGLDPANPADVAAAFAYRWAQEHGPWLFGTPTTGPVMQAMAERVMRAVRADPSLLARAQGGDASANDALKAAGQGSALQAVAVETRNDEERALVADMIAQKKSGAEIQAALDELRRRRGSAISLPANPDDLLKQGWTEIGHPSAAEAGHRTFRNSETGAVIRFDKGEPGKPGLERKDHYHWLNPDRSRRGYTYLDAQGPAGPSRQ